MTIARNNIVRTLGNKSIFENAKPVLTSTIDWNQGDLLAFDTATNSIKVVKKGGSHGTRINNLPDKQRQQVLDSLNSWLLKDDMRNKKLDRDKKRK